MTQAEREEIIWAWICHARLQIQLSTPDGRWQLARAMINPIRCGGLDYGTV